MSDEVTDMLAMPCGHAFCYDCWNDFCVNAIKDGPACVKTTCPQAGCPEVVTEDEMTKALGDASSELKKFQTYQLRSFFCPIHSLVGVRDVVVNVLLVPCRLRRWNPKATSHIATPAVSPSVSSAAKSLMLLLRAKISPCGIKMPQ